MREDPYHDFFFVSLGFLLGLVPVLLLFLVIYFVDSLF